jgi:trimethylamine--corrinoid protein Co-methyltransferase
MRRSIRAGKFKTGGITFSVLSESDMDRIHAATLEVLWQNGVYVEDEEALEVFDGGGATIDPKTKIVKIPSYVLEEAVSSAPETVILAGRNPDHDIVVDMNRVLFDPFGEGILMVDPQTFELRSTTKADLAESTRLMDYLENMDICHRIMGSLDVAQEVASAHNAEAMLLNTTKHCFIGPQSGYLAKKILEMTAAVVGGKDKLTERPIMTFGTALVSPLRMIKDFCQIVMTTARSGLPVEILGQGMAGGSSPITLAGALVTHNAEVLSGVVLSQLTQKGAPCFYGSSACSMDLRYGSAMVGNPETALLSAATAQLARKYLLPSWIAGG